MMQRGANFRGASNLDMRGSWVTMPLMGGTQQVWQNSALDQAVEDELIRQIKLDHPKDPAQWGVTQQQHDNNVYNGYIQPAVADFRKAIQAGQVVSITVRGTGQLLSTAPPSPAVIPPAVSPAVPEVIPAAQLPAVIPSSLPAPPASPYTPPTVPVNYSPIVQPAPAAAPSSKTGLYVALAAAAAAGAWWAATRPADPTRKERKRA